MVLENEKQPPHPEEIQGNDTASTAERQPVNDVTRLRELFRRSRFSRVHGRFVTPVIMYQGKNICRSATLSIQVEMFLNKTKEFIGSWSWFGGGSSKSRQNQTDFQQPTSTNLEQQREADLALLEALKLQYICDLMVETKKKKSVPFYPHHPSIHPFPSVHPIFSLSSFFFPFLPSLIPVLSCQIWDAVDII